MKNLISLVFLVFSFAAQAQFNAGTPRGKSRLTFMTPQGDSEICVIPQHSPWASYSKKDQQDEAKLCSYDFHGLTNDRKVTPMALCPKLNSTNPGVLVMEIPKQWTRTQFESEKCLTDNDLQNTKAKFKQTVTCSYTPSILAYYHFSRLLGDIGKVPVAVLRTMSTARHLPIVEQGKRGTQKIGGAIHKGWDILREAHGRTSTTPLLFDTSGKFLFGALQENVKNEARYHEIIGTGPYEERYNNFVKKDFYKQLQNPDDILNVLGRQDFETVVQPLLTLKDAADLILIDTLLGQQDRMYNQHFKWAWAWLEDGKIKRQTVATKMDEKGKLQFISEKDLKEKAEFEQKRAVLVKEMILKDNDCGVRARFYRNRMKEVKAIEGISHISGETYTAFLKLHASLKNPAMLEYLKNETLMTDADINAILKNTNEVEALLRGKCRSGQLKLDLDLETYFGSQPKFYSCDP